MSSISALRLRATNLALFMSNGHTHERLAIDALRRHAYTVTALPRHSAILSLTSMLETRAEPRADRSEKAPCSVHDSCVIVDGRVDGPEISEIVRFCQTKKLPLLSYNWPVAALPPAALSSLSPSLHVPLPHAAGLDDVAVTLLGTMGSKAREVLQEGFHAFGPHVLHPSQIFYRSRYSLACVNIKPVLPGHCLVLSARPCARFTALTDKEVADLWLTARTVGSMLEQHHRGTALTLAIQDGADAGQSVPHVHVHVLPRAQADLPENDEIYNMIDESGRGHAVPMDPGVMRPQGVAPAAAEGTSTAAVDTLAGGQPETVGGASRPGVQTTAGRKEDIRPVHLRPLRSLEHMAEEAAVYRRLLSR